jgi:hypothetical protein
MTRKKKLMRTDMRTYLDVFRLCFDDQLSHRQINIKKYKEEKYKEDTHLKI